MKTGLNKAIIAIGLCAMALLFAGSARAESEEQVAEELISGLGISSDVASTLVSGPGVTFGQRIEGAYNNGTISKEQYGAIINRFLALPDEKRWAIKGAWDAGKGINPQVLHNVVNPQDPASMHQHVKDLRDQGYTKEQIAARLKAEGVAPEHIKAIVYPQGVSNAGEGSQRGEHLKEIRDSGNQPQQVDKAHERYQARKAEPSKVDKAKDNPQRAKNVRDTRPAARDKGHAAAQRRR